MHTAHVLNEEIFPVEIVWLAIFRRTLIASPEVKLYVLGADVAFPFVLTAKGGCAAVDRKRAGETPCIASSEGRAG